MVTGSSLRISGNPVADLLRVSAEARRPGGLQVDFRWTFWDMFTVRVGKLNKVTMARGSHISGRFLQLLMTLLLLILVIIIVMQQYDVSNEKLSDIMREIRKAKPTNPPVNQCSLNKTCPHDHFSFYLQSGAATMVAPKICVQNKLVMGSVMNNVGHGINILVLNGKTGERVKSGHFNMNDRDVSNMVKFLMEIQKGSVVLMASYNDAASKLNNDARKLIGKLGSSLINSLQFRDNWVFVGGKGATVMSNFEKHGKSNPEKTKYGAWPELVNLEGCIPKFMEYEK
ncbi:protein FAM3C-like [Pholidichthys leucotaenia]